MAVMVAAGPAPAQDAAAEQDAEQDAVALWAVRLYAFRDPGGMG